MKRAIGYCRVSTEKQDLKRQEQLINDYCDVNDYVLVDIIEEKVSGTKNEIDREGLKKLYNLKGDEAELIVVSELSRLSREDDALEVLNRIKTLLNLGFDVIFLDKPEKIYKAKSSLNLVDIITLSVEANHAAEDRKKLISRMKTGKYTKIRTNPYMFIGGTPPYGFIVAPNPEHLGQKDSRSAKSIMVTNDEEIGNVKLIYSWILGGMTVRDAAKKANELGFKTKENKPFNQTSIAKIVKNPIYKGKRRFKDFNLITEIIVTENDWELAQERMHHNKIYKGNGNKHFNPLKGIVFCPCGYAMMLHEMGGKRDGSYLTLHCCVRHRPEYGHKCKNSGIKADILFDAVWKCVRSVILEKEYRSKNKDDIRVYEQSIKTLNNRIIDLNKSIIKAKAEKEKIPDLILRLSALNTPSEELLKSYNNKYLEYEKMIKEQEAKIEVVNNEIIKYQSKIKDINNISILKELNAIDETEKADIYKKVLEKVVYYSENQLSGYIVVTFKNGLVAIIIKMNQKKRCTAQLPYTFKFDAINRKVLVPFENFHGLAFNETEYRAFGIKEIKEQFDIEKWII